jgi:hypothetical protein
VVHTRVLGTSTQSFPEKLILDFGATCRGLQRLAIELREAEAARAAANITERLDAVMDEDGEKIAKVMIRMANGEQDAAGGVRWSRRGALGGPNRILPKGGWAARAGIREEYCHFAGQGRTGLAGAKRSSC